MARAMGVQSNCVFPPAPCQAFAHDGRSITPRPTESSSMSCAAGQTAYVGLQTAGRRLRMSGKLQKQVTCLDACCAILRHVSGPHCAAVEQTVIDELMAMRPATCAASTVSPSASPASLRRVRRRAVSLAAADDMSTFRSQPTPSPNRSRRPYDAQEPTRLYPGATTAPGR